MLIEVIIQCLDNLMAYCIEQDKFSALLSYLFDKTQFADALSGYNVAEIDASYTYITSCTQIKIQTGESTRCSPG